MNYREQAREDLREWERTVLNPALKEDIERLMLAAGLDEEEATFVVLEELKLMLWGLHGFPSGGES